jgi:signal transduction histidine kinase
VNRRSITFRLVSWYCGLLLLLGVASAVYTYTNFGRYIAESTRNTLASRALAVWEISQDLLTNQQALSAVMEQRFAPEAQNRFLSISLNGHLIYRSGSPAEHGFDPSTVPDETIQQSPQVVRYGDLMLYTQQFTLPDGRKVTVQSGSAADTVVAAKKNLATSLLIGMPLLLIFAAGGGYWLVNRALAPVKAMIGAAEALTFNSPHNRLPSPGTGDDIDALSRTLNRMLERLDHAYQHASRFSADAAHELRTPLSIMRGELELLASQRGLTIEVQNALGNILDETARLGQIVGNLTALSHLDSIAGKRTHLAVDLDVLAAETIDQMRLLAEEKNISLSYRKTPDVFAAGDRDRLKQLLVNLLDNAIKYTLSGGAVTVAVGHADENAILTVADTGIGIKQEDITRIFDRFFRVTADRGETGAGLGLAIVRAICVAHGGTVSVNSTPNVGSTFQVALPQAPAALIGGLSNGQNPEIIRRPDMTPFNVGSTPTSA